LESIASLIARVNENTGFSGYGKAFPSILPVIQNELARMNSGLGTFRQDQIESMSRINSSLIDSVLSSGISKSDLLSSIISNQSHSFAKQLISSDQRLVNDALGASLDLSNDIWATKLSTVLSKYSTNSFSEYSQSLSSLNTQLARIDQLSDDEINREWEKLQSPETGVNIEIVTEECEALAFQLKADKPNVDPISLRKRVLIIFAVICSIIQFFNDIHDAVVNVASLLEPKIEKAESSSQVKSIVKQSAGEIGFDYELLKNMRATSGDRVHLRETPSVQGEILEVLPKQTMLVVLDNSNRKWLEVQVRLGDTVITGWVSRKYTIHFN